MEVIIIDDERLARKELRDMLKSFKDIEILDEAADADEAKKKIEELRPELIFLDIQMPGKDGFALLEELSYVPEVIFVTAYDEYALKAFDVNALDYLLKPIQTDRLKESVNKVQENISEKSPSEKEDEEAPLGENEQVFVKDGDRCWFVKLKEVRMFESEGNYVKVHFRDQKPLILKSLNNLEKKLNNRVFFRANRKYIINLNWVENIESWFNGGLQVTLNKGEKVEISRRQATKLKDMMSL